MGKRGQKIFAGFVLTFVVVIILVVNVLRFYQTDKIPFGFHVDELSGAVTIECLATQGVDAHNRPYPLFGDVNYGTPKPPTYIYPALVWGNVFGHSVPSLRLFISALVVLSILGLFLLARLLFGLEMALWTALAASISPWMWVLGRVAVESMVAPIFLIWGLFIFLRYRIWWGSLLSGFMFSCALYSYPPFRAFVPLMLVVLFIYVVKTHNVSRTLWAIFLLGLIVPSIPLIQKTLSGQLQGRFNSISIASPKYLQSVGKKQSLPDLSEIFLKNYSLHLSPKFLIKSGDPSAVHSTGRVGILSWLDLVGILAAFLWILLQMFKKEARQTLYKNDFWFLLFIILNIFLAIAPSALTNSELPNSLRIIGAWPFVCLLTGYGIWRMTRACAGLMPVAVIIAGVFAWFFLQDYFVRYPKESKGMFSFWTLEHAQQLKNDEQWLNFIYQYRHQDYHCRYFMMKYRGDSCTETKEVWEKFRKIWRN